MRVGSRSSWLRPPPGIRSPSCWDCLAVAEEHASPSAPLTTHPTCLPPPPSARSFNKSAGHSNRALQSPVPTCHIWADHRYRMLYVRNFKTAGTSISITLGQKELPMYCT